MYAFKSAVLVAREGSVNGPPKGMAGEKFVGPGAPGGVDVGNQFRLDEFEERVGATVVGCEAIVEGGGGGWREVVSALGDAATGDADHQHPGDLVDFGKIVHHAADEAKVRFGVEQVETA